MQPTFWGRVWQCLCAIGRFFAHNALAPIVALLIVVGAILLVAMGFKDLQVGGLLSWLLRKPQPGIKAIDIANTIPAGRVDKNGNLIPLGQPDSQGDTQIQVVPIKEPGLFSDPTVVEYTPPGTDTTVEVKLPDGVKAPDVDRIVVVQPDVVVVTVKDNTGLTTERIDDLLQKYER